MSNNTENIDRNSVILGAKGGVC